MLLVNELPPQHSCKLDISKKKNMSCALQNFTNKIPHIQQRSHESFIGRWLWIKSTRKEEIWWGFGRAYFSARLITNLASLGEIRNQRPFRLVLGPFTGMDFCIVSLVSHRLRYSPVLILSVLHCWNKIPKLETFQGQHLQSFILKFPPLPQSLHWEGTRVPTHNPFGHKSIISKSQHGLTLDEMVPHGRVNLGSTMT